MDNDSSHSDISTTWMPLGLTRCVPWQDGGLPEEGQTPGSRTYLQSWPGASPGHFHWPPSWGGPWIPVLPLLSGWAAMGGSLSPSSPRAASAHWLPSGLSLPAGKASLGTWV